MKKNHWIVIILFLTGLYACKKEIIEASATTFAGFKKPANFPEPAYHFNTNKVTRGGFELGRTLFYDPILSADNTISCGNCHIQTSAFTQHGHSVSHGIHDLQGTRNSPPIMNLAWYTSFMWDGGIADLDLQPLAPIANHVEMDENITNVLAKLRAKPAYGDLFKKAFGSNEISSTTFLKALSQFMTMCVSSNSKYDSVKRNEGKIFTADEQLGYTVFLQKCNSCHTEPLFTDNSFRNNGISISGINDEGRYLTTLNAVDRYKFRVPSLRNLSYTAPYMHDGRFFTLDAVLDHYNSHVQNTPNLDLGLQTGGGLGIPISPTERSRLIAFLNTLNDKVFITDKRFSEQ